MPLARRAAEWLLAILVALVAAEGALRAFQRVHPTFVLAGPSYNRFRGRPGTLVFGRPLNSGGFKDVEHARDKAPGTFRIVALGDSFAFGSVPYEDNYLTLLGHRLGTTTRPVEVINMGISGAGPQDYLALLRDEGLAFHPDLVLVSFFVGNDFTDTKRARRRSVLDASAVATVCRYAWGLAFKTAGRVAVSDQYDDGAPTWTDEAYLAMEADRSRIDRKDALATGEHGPVKRIFLDPVDFLTRIRSSCAGRGIALAVAIIPDEVQVNPRLQARVVEALKVEPGTLDFRQPNRFLEERLTAAGIDHLDLLDRFVSAAAAGPLYKPNDSHWNLAGNRLAAEALADFLAPRLKGDPE
jgi:lysophospholipase L1-like esterase